MRSLLRWPAVVGLGVLTLQACGGDDSSQFSVADDAGGGGQAASAGQGGGGAAGMTGAAGGGGTSGVDAGVGGAAGAPGAGGSPIDAGMDAMVDAPPQCSDADLDRDGQSECDGDCDDDDSQNFVGNREICGDLADNNCDGVTDEAAVCAGLGTFVSALTGVDTNPGTQEQPVKSIGKGMANAQTIAMNAGGRAEVFVAEGTYPETQAGRTGGIQLIEGISLFGGFECSAQPCSWSRDPAQNTTTIQNQDAQGVIADDTVTRMTRFDGFRVEGATGSASAPGLTALRLNGGSPTLTNNTIVGGEAISGASVAVAILPFANDVRGPLIDSNTIEAGRAATESVAILMTRLSTQGPTSVFATITRNTIRGGSGARSQAITLWDSGGGTLIRNNDIFGGEGRSGPSWAILGGSQADIEGNRINMDRTSPPTCSSDGWCGGIWSESMTSTITNNVIFGADSIRSTAVRLSEFETPRGAIVLNGNYLDGGAGTNSAALVLSSGPVILSGTVARIGRIRNNIFVGGSATNTYGVYEDDIFYTTTNPGPKEHHPAALTHNDFFLPAATPASPDAGVTGTHVLYRRWDGTAGHDVTDIASVNGLGSFFGVPVQANFEADPTVSASFHLMTGSPCIDAGTSLEAPAIDFEGDSRPEGASVDVGPDEHVP